MAPEIRPAAPGDARAIAEAHVASWRWAYRGLIPEGAIEALSVEDRERMWTGRLADPEPRTAVFVARGAEDAAAGFVSAGPSRDDGAEPDTGEVYAIYVRPEVQGTGVGRMLFQAALERMGSAGFRRATLWVLEDNDLGRRFYEKAGWVWDGSTSTHQIECANLPVVRYARDL